MVDAIVLECLYMTFGKETILKNVNTVFETVFETGKIHGIVGRNGSGKTVLMKCILGFLKPTKGSVTVLGRRIGPECNFAPETGMIIEAPGFIPTESGYSNLKWLMGLRGKVNKKRIEEVMSTVGLDPGNKKPVGKYSLGMRQRLGIAQAIMERPRLLVLDEPMNGLDNRGAEDMRKLFLQLNEEGSTILLAPHNPLDIDTLCNTVYEIDAGVLEKRK